MQLDREMISDIRCRRKGNRSIYILDADKLSLRCKYGGTTNVKYGNEICIMDAVVIIQYKLYRANAIMSNRQTRYS